MTRRLSEYIVMAAFAVALILAPLATVAPTTASQTGASTGPDSRPSSRWKLEATDGPWPSILKQVVDDWNKNETVTFRIVPGGTGPQECRPVTGRVETCNWRYGTQEGWLGLTTLLQRPWRSCQSATVQMNDSFFDTNSQYNNDAARRHTMCHELGHTPGLDHVGTNSCMNDSQFAVFNNLHPINKDFNQLAHLQPLGFHDDRCGQASEREEGQEGQKVWQEGQEETEPRPQAVSC